MVMTPPQVRGLYVLLTPKTLHVYLESSQVEETISSVLATSKLLDRDFSSGRRGFSFSAELQGWHCWDKGFQYLA